MLVGLVMAQRGGLPRKPITALYLAWALGMLMTAGFGLVTSLWQAMAVAFVAEGSIAVLIVIWYTPAASIGAARPLGTRDQPRSG